MNETLQRIREVLDEVASADNGVTVELVRRGVKGRREDSEECPIARLIKSELPEGWTVCVGEAMATIRDESDPTKDGIDYDLNLPHQITAFVKAFDDGAYSEVLGD